jgi:hypothetical protein
MPKKSQQTSKCAKLSRFLFNVQKLALTLKFVLWCEIVSWMGPRSAALLNALRISGQVGKLVRLHVNFQSLLGEYSGIYDMYGKNSTPVRRVL